MAASSSVNINQLCSKSRASDEEMNDLVQLKDSFSYDCGKYFNLAIIEETLLFSGGNLIQLLDTRTGAVTFKRSVGGAGIGHITTNPHYSHVAVGERGDGPSIFVYTWPEFNLVSRLENGTERSYAYLDYSPDGEILCSQGAAPDFTLALWNWKRATLLMRCHPSTQVVHRAAFSRMQPDIIITCGYSHIGFWRTAKTFTGLKMTGEVGRFGATEASDVVNFECIEDGKVASGCEWGNILVWGGAIIEHEICTRRDVTCHAAPVFAFHRNNNNLVSIGSDGWVRVWELNGGSRSQENSRVLRKQEALLYFSIGDNTRLFSKVDLPGTSPGEEVWFLQDGSGAIYRADVGAALQGHEAAPAVSRLLRCHATSVVTMATCPHDTKLATLAKDGRLLVYDYTSRHVLERECGLPGTVLIWLPVEMDDSGSRVALGFETGAVSICTLLWGSGVVREVQSWRPHSDAVTAIAASSCALATASRDQNIFLFGVQMQPRLNLVPRGFIVTSQLVMSLHWHHSKSNTLLSCSCDGQLQEFVISDSVAPTEAESLKLEVTPERVLNLASLAPDLKLGNKPQETEEQTVLSQDTTTVLSGRYHGENSVILVLKGHTEVTVCEVNLETEVLESSQIPMPGKKRPTISCGVFTIGGECIVTGFDSGEIQLSLLESDGTWTRYWRLAMHEGDLGSHVTDVAFSFDQTHFFSCGQDGNVFVYRLTQEVAPVPTVLLPTTVPLEDEKRIGIPVQNITLTLEEIRQLKEEKRKANEIKRKRASIIERLEQLKVKYTEIVESAAGEEDLLPGNPEELHPRLMEKFEAEVDKMRAEMLGEIVPRVKKSEIAWTEIYKYFLSDLHADSLRVCSFSDDCYAESYRLKKLDEKLLEEYAEMEKKLDEETSSKSSLLITESTSTLRSSVSTEISEAQETTPKPQESVSTCPTLVLERMRQRHVERKLRLQQLEQLMLDKPPSTPDPETYEEKIHEAEQSIGDYKLKCEPGYRTPHDQRASTLRTQHQKVEVKLKIYSLKEEFNREIFELKLRKNKLISRYTELSEVNESIKNNKALNEKMKLREEELPEKDLLKLCGGRGSDFGIETFLGEEFYDKINTCVGLLAAMSRFDASVRSQLEQRVSLDVRLCLLELRATSLRQEMIVLTELEPQDLELTERLRVAKEKKSKLQYSLLDVNDNIKKRKRSLVDLNRLEKDIERRFHCHTEASSFYEHLTLLFKMRYRPPSLSIGSTVTESSHESETSSETTDTPHSTARKRRSVISDRVCPPGCELELFELTNALRLEKYELNLKLEEERKDLELMKKDQEITIKKINLVNNAIKGILEEIDVFEQERQGRLNALQVVVPLSMHQLPADARLSECVVMPKSILERLQNRAGQLKSETSQLEEQLTEDKRKLKAMKLQCKTTEKDILILKNKIQETMLKRFGKIINLEEMESAILNLGNEEKAEDELQSEREMKIKISQLQKEVSKVKVEINQGLIEKAENLRILASIMKKNNDLNEPKFNRHERCGRGRGLLSLQHLHEVMTSQREQISSLRHELGMLRCKMTSSRDLFPSTRPASATNGIVSEESEATEEQTPGRRRRGSVVDLTSSTPEILIEHCSEEEDPDD